MQELVQLNSLPLDIKIRKTENRIREWYEHYEGNVYISFSGGKDSTVLLDIARNLYPDIEAVYCDTGLEYPEIKDFVKTFPNTTIIRPRYSFKEVLDKYGYPIISKESNGAIEGTRRFLSMYITEGKQDSHSVEKLEKYIEENVPHYLSQEAWGVKRLYPPDQLRLINTKVAKTMGLLTKDNQILQDIPVGKKSGFSQAKWRFLLNSDFKISNKCCYHMKKAPLAKFERETGKKPIIATMASDSLLRKSAWLRDGCNTFNTKKQVSRPMSFWMENDVLKYIDEHNLPYCSVYGNLKNMNGTYYFDGCQRTGCVFCGYGIHLESHPNRFEKLKETHPQLYNYCMRGGQFDEFGWWHPSKDGLGMSHVLDYIDVEY